MNLACHWKQCLDKLYARLLVFLLFFLQSNMYMAVPSQLSYRCTEHCETVQVHAGSGRKCFLLRGCNVQSKANQGSGELKTSKLSIFGFYLYNFNSVAPFNSEVLCCYLSVVLSVQQQSNNFLSVFFGCHYVGDFAMVLSLRKQEIHAERRRMWKEGFKGMLVLHSHDRSKNTPT